MKHIIFLLLAIMSCSSAAFADTQTGSAPTPADEAQMHLLAKWVQNARAFDRAFTREKVYLHLDNTAYFEDETIWFKAYVVRASTLCPDTALSRVLYVDLLDSRGETVEQKIVHIDELGQGEGAFELADPVRSGYYELRAYTRGMTNWGTDACFSRVIPVFKGAYREKLEMQAALAAASGKTSEPLDLEVPMPEDDPNLIFGAKRPVTPRTTTSRLTFFPEGGNRVGGVEQSIAYQHTDEHGLGLAGTVSIRRADGTLVAESVANDEGMGRFTLPADLPAGEPLYALTADKRYTLPDVVSHAQYALAVDPVFSADADDCGEVESYDVHIRANADRERLLGLLVSCRARPCYFDTIQVFAHDDIVLSLDAEALHDGVNSIDLFDEDGHSLCRRLVWKQPDAHRNLNLNVRQNAATFAAFSPIAIDLRLNDCEGIAVPDATFSVCIRNADADVVASPAVDLTTELLLSSELRGYIHRPEQYCVNAFTDADDRRRAAQAIDLLLMVQGWSAVDFETLAGARNFNLQQPIEQHLMLDGTVYRDDDKHTPFPNLNLHLQMYTRQGASLEAYATTDAEGHFAFESSKDYCGEWIAQFVTDEITTNRRGEEVAKKRWSRIALNRWFAPKLRPYSPFELDLQPPVSSLFPPPSSLFPPTSSLLPPPSSLFEWTDTIPRVMISQELSEAVVVHENGYRGLIGNRYTYNGGEAAALRRPSFYINVGRENERRKDAGLDDGTIFDIITEAIDRKLEITQPTQSSAELVELSQYADDNVPKIRINGRECIFFLNNELVGYGFGNSNAIFENDKANEFKSVVIMPERNDWMRFWPIGNASGLPDAELPYYNGKPYIGVFLYNRPDYFRYFTKKGVDKRMIQGFDVPRKFYTPQYNGLDEPSLDDFRRTLCWRPSVTTDQEGHASVVFFNDAVESQRIAISIRGITPDGSIISFDR